MLDSKATVMHVTVTPTDARFGLPSPRQTRPDLVLPGSLPARFSIHDPGSAPFRRVLPVSLRPGPAPPVLEPVWPL